MKLSAHELLEMLETVMDEDGESTERVKAEIRKLDEEARGVSGNAAEERGAA